MDPTIENCTMQKVSRENISESEHEEIFKKQRQEYLAIKLNRKKEQLKIKLEEFGLSSSDEEENPFSESSQSPKNQPLNQKQVEKESTKIESTQKGNQKIELLLQAKKQWIKEFLLFNEAGGFILAKYNYDIKGIRKLKLFSESVQKCFKMKITYLQANQVMVALSNTEKIRSFSLCYYFFARIIENKMLMLGMKKKENKGQILSGIPEMIISKAYIFGKLYKKSQVLGKWEERFIVINKQGLHSYKKFNEKSTMFIEESSIKELWTRFEQHEEMLVIKMKHGSTKTEFGIPFCNYLSEDSWLYHFYLMLMRNK